jgi:cyclic lactone autoinducer peptide
MTIRAIFTTICAKISSNADRCDILASTNVRKEDLAVKKLTHRLNKTLAALTHRVAVQGAGLASLLGWYQPKVPEKLAK